MCLGMYADVYAGLEARRQPPPVPHLESWGYRWLWTSGFTAWNWTQVFCKSSAHLLLTLEERASERASEHLEQVCLDVGRVPICIPAFQKPMQEDCYKSQASQRTPFLKTSSSDNRQANKTAANPNKPSQTWQPSHSRKWNVCCQARLFEFCFYGWLCLLVNTVEMCEEIDIIEREWTTWIHGIGVRSDGIGSLMGYWSTSQRQLTWKVSQGLQSFNRHSVLKMRESPIRSSKTWTS